MMKSIWALIAVAFLAGGWHVCAQTQQTVSSELVGNTEAPGTTQFITLSVSGNTGTLALPLGNLAPEPEKSSWIRSKRFVPGLFEEMVDWMVRQSRPRASGRTSRRS